MTRDQSMEPRRSMEDEIDVRALLQTLWRRRATIAAIAAACGLLAAGLSFLVLPPVYESRTQILLSEHSAAAYSTAESAARVLTGPSFLDPIAQSTGIQVDGRDLQRLVRASAVGETRIVDLRIRYSDPVRLRAFTDVVVREFVRRASERVEQRRTTVERRLADVTAQLNEFERTLNVTRRTLERLQAEAPTDPASWFARSFVLNSLGTSEGLYGGLLNTQRELRNEILGLEPPTLVQAPYVSSRPVSPRPLLNTGVAFTLGLVVGVILAFILDAFSSPATVRVAAASETVQQSPLLR